MAYDIEMIRSTYERTVERVDGARKILGRPLTLTEKILYSHLIPGNEDKKYERGND